MAGDGGTTAFVHEAELELQRGVDPAAVGAAVTTALCGHWEHDGRCRWPHNNDIRADGGAFRFRTLFLAPPAEEDEVRQRIDAALRAARAWVVVRAAPRPVAPAEHPLAARLRGALDAGG